MLGEGRKERERFVLRTGKQEIRHTRGHGFLQGIERETSSRMALLAAQGN